MGWSKKNGIWQPHRDPACIEWFDADIGVAQSGNAASSWAGRKSKYTLTAGNSPTFTRSNSTFADHATVTCAANTTQYLTDASFALPEPCFIFAITQIPALQAYNCELVDAQLSGRRIIGFSSTGKAQIYEGAMLTTAATPGTVVAYLAYFSGSTTSAIYLNSTAPSVTGSCGSGSITGIMVGNCSSAYSYSTPWGAPIQSIGFFSGTPTVRQISALMQYAKRKCGVVIS